MKILAFDTSCDSTSIAITNNDELLIEYNINYKKKQHSQILFAILKKITQDISLNLKSIDYIAVTSGPGSFTGLRISAATAKGLCIAMNKPLITIPTLDVIACNLYYVYFNILICTIIYAKNKYVYASIYFFKKNKLKILRFQKIISIKSLIKLLNKITKKVIFLGNIINKYKNIIKKICNINFLFVPFYLNMPRASIVANIAIKYYKKGIINNYMNYTPNYIGKM